MIIVINGLIEVPVGECVKIHDKIIRAKDDTAEGKRCVQCALEKYSACHYFDCAPQSRTDEKAIVFEEVKL